MELSFDGEYLLVLCMFLFCGEELLKLMVEKLVVCFLIVYIYNMYGLIEVIVVISVIEII